MRKLSTIMVVTLALACGALSWAGDNDKEMAKLQGTWKLVSVTQGGQPISNPTGGKVVLWTFEKDKATFKIDDKTDMGTYKIDAAKKPMQLDLSKGKDPKDNAQAIFTVDGETLKVGMGVSRDKDKIPPRPGDFGEKDSLVLTFKKEAAK
jgi:uncharacterized protein (TIGR03067 family)